MKRIAIQGIRGSFHHEAALHYFGEGIEPEECETFTQVADQVLCSNVDFGLMAIENSLAGSIVPNYGLLQHNKLSVVGELILRVRMNLMVLNGAAISDVKEIHSHQMAIRQCSSFLHQHTGSKVVEAFDTAGSAQYIKENHLQNIAAIASEFAAETYGLSILRKGIENEESFTRFLVLSKGKEEKDIQADKASLYLQTAHESGALAKVLSVISNQGINLSKLQSHPVSGRDRTYGFFMDLEFDSSIQFERAMSELKEFTEVLDVLGTYKKGKTYE